MGKIIAQSIHAARQFQYEHSEIEKQWFEKSNYVVVLGVNNEIELNQLVNKAKICKIRYSEFREPDLDYSLTAIALEPGRMSRKLCSRLELV